MAIWGTGRWVQGDPAELLAAMWRPAGAEGRSAELQVVARASAWGQAERLDFCVGRLIVSGESRGVKSFQRSRWGQHPGAKGVAQECGLGADSTASPCGNPVEGGALPGLDDAAGLVVPLVLVSLFGVWEDGVPRLVRSLVSGKLKPSNERRIASAQFIRQGLSAAQDPAAPGGEPHDVGLPMVAWTVESPALER